MTEAEWLACEDPTRMLEFLRGKVSERKLRLIACAVVRQIWEYVAQDSRSRQSVEVAERFADGLATADELARAHEFARYATDEMEFRGDRVELLTGYAAAWTSLVSAGDAAGLTAGGAEVPRLHGAVCAAVCRDILGNPFRPVSPGPWVTPAAATVARDCYDRRDFSALPLFADLLEEAGCPEQSVLDHCRQPVEHARGCWAVDLVLGRE
jgi:hypothetical protein